MVSLQNSHLEKYLKTHHKTHLIFDFDETICWLILPWEHWGDKIKDKLIILDNTIYQNYEQRKISLSALQNRYIAKFPSTRNLFIKNNTWFETTFIKEVIPNSQLVQFIANNQNTKKYTFHLWSSNTKKTVTTVLKKHNLSYKFNKIITRNDVALLKPNQEGFTLIKDNNIPLTKYIFIGDSTSDKQAAQALGIDFYKVTYFNQRKFKHLRSKIRINLN